MAVPTPSYENTIVYFVIGLFMFSFLQTYISTRDYHHKVKRFTVQDDTNFTKLRSTVRLKKERMNTETYKRGNVTKGVDESSDNIDDTRVKLIQHSILDYKPKKLLDLSTNFNLSNEQFQNSSEKHIILWFNPPEWVERHQRDVDMEKCEYNNCVYTKDNSFTKNSSAIVYVPTEKGMYKTPPLSSKERHHNQIWVAYSLEPPMNYAFKDYKSNEWMNTVNWTMTYRFDSDILAPYGTLKSRKLSPFRDYNEVYQRKTKMAAWIVSHCHAISGRDEYVAELKKEGIEVDILGKCGESIDHFNDTQIEDRLNSYKFFIAFENSICKDYVSCKFFKKYNLDLILIVRGGADYDKLLPTKTFINTADFPNISSLANHVRQLAANKIQYIRFLRRKDKYEVMNEAEFGYPYAMCELCRKLNNKKDNKNSYKTITDFLEDKTCRLPGDIPNFVLQRPFNSKIYA